MKKLSITKKFYFVFIGSALFLACAGKILFVLYKTAAADIMIAGSSSFFLRALPYISGFCAELFSRGAFVMAVCGIVYAVSYFGKNTGISIVLLSMAIQLAGELLLFLYNITCNVVGKASMLAWLVSACLEFLFSSALLWLTYYIARQFALKRFHGHKPNRLNLYAPLRAVFLSLGITCILYIVVLSLTKVIPFLLQYQGITVKETMDIAYDYGYYIFWYLGISFCGAIPFMKLLNKATGRLQPKDFRAEKI